MATPRATPDPLFANPEEFAQAGERIYLEHKADLEKAHMGRFVAVDVVTRKFYIDDAAEVALDSGRKDHPAGIFHLIRIGSSGAYKLGHSINASRDRRFR
jgi:hypothetical protein